MLEFLISIVTTALSVMVLAVGLGLVIFVHELGHFAVAKWVGVLVERFSIGFGPVVWSFRRGETEYAISAIPFGGYVKMLGQDDANPGEMVRDEIRLNPRSYPAQSVPKRMAIISAGVVMNLIFGFVLFLIVYNVGVPYTPALIGGVEPGGPAWESGIMRGDKVLRVNGEEVIEFEHLQQAIVLSEPGVSLEMEVDRNGKTMVYEVVPAMKHAAPEIGITFSADLTVSRLNPTAEGFAASRAEGGSFQGGDRITQVNGQRVESYPEFARLLALHAADTLRITVERAKDSSGTPAETVEVVVPPQPFRDWGLRFQMGKVTSVRAGSPAANAGIRVGDMLERVGGEPCDPFRLPNTVAAFGAREIEIELKRNTEGEQQTIKLSVVPDESQPPWINPPNNRSPFLTVPSLGIAYQLVQAVTESPKPGSPAAEAGIQKNDRIAAITVIMPERGRTKKEEKKQVIDEKHAWLPVYFWELQSAPDAQIKFTVIRDGKEVETGAFSPQLDPSWPSPIRGIGLGRILTEQLPPQGFTRAIALGYEETKSTVTTIYLMLRRLIFSRTVSPTLLTGPVGIAQVGFYFASMDIRLFIKFLAMLSVNLAIINFLPIPVLDGGHMVLLGWEAIRGKPASERVVIAANYCGLLLIISLALFVTWNDLARLVR